MMQFAKLMVTTTPSDDKHTNRCVYYALCRVFSGTVSVGQQMRILESWRGPVRNISSGVQVLIASLDCQLGEQELCQCA
jgi:translation elongation factor EF-G